MKFSNSCIIWDGLTFGSCISKKAPSSSRSRQILIAGDSLMSLVFALKANPSIVIFLLLTLPYILNTEKNTLKVVYLFCISICFNSLIFEGGDSYSLSYFIKASIVYLLKFIILFINCVFFGEVCNRFINININFIKNK